MTPETLTSRTHSPALHTIGAYVPGPADEGFTSQPCLAASKMRGETVGPGGPREVVQNTPDVPSA